MNITLEQIDEVRVRTNCSYEEAKMLLEKHNGDSLEAIIEFEKKYGASSSKDKSKKERKSEAKNENRAGNIVKPLIKKGKSTRFILEKDGNAVVNIPIWVPIVILFIPPILFWVAIALIVMLVAGYKIKIGKEDGGSIDVSGIIDEAAGKVKASQAQAAPKEEQKNADEKKQNKDDDFNEITIE